MTCIDDQGVVVVGDRGAAIDRRPPAATAGGDRWRPARVAVVAVAAFLLLSMGGAVLLAPVTVPALWWAVRTRPTVPLRVAGAVVGGLTAAEVGWAVAYVAAGEGGPWVWLAPLVAGAALAWALGRPAGAPPERR